MKRLAIHQGNLPPWERVERGMRAIFERSYFANNGPLVQELDGAMAALAGVQYGVCMTNEMMAMMLLAKSQFQLGEVVVPAFFSSWMIEALLWGGYVPVVADVDPRSWTLSPRTVLSAITAKTTGIVGVQPLGRLAACEELERFASDQGLPLIFDASDALGCTLRGRNAGEFGDGAVFSFGPPSLLNAGEGGCVTTRELEVANRLRTLRNFHPGQTFADMPLRMNGKMAEASAMVALTGLSEVSRSIERNRERFTAYRDALRRLPGVKLAEPDADVANYQRVVIEIDPLRAGVDAASLSRALTAESVSTARPLELAPVALGPMPVAEIVYERLLELPNAPDVTAEDAQRIAASIAAKCGAA